MIKTRVQRLNEIKPILEKLSQMHLKIVEHSELQLLLSCTKQFLESGTTTDIPIAIPFPALNCQIDGCLATKVGDRTWVRLTTAKNQDQ